MKYFNLNLYERIKSKLAQASPGFPIKNFLRQNISGKMPIRDRCMYIAEAIEKGFIAQGRRPTLNEWKKFLGPELTSSKGMFTEGYWLMPISWWIEKYLLNEPKPAFALMYELTKRHTAEYCLRPFVIQNHSQVFTILKKWTDDSNEHIRRLASEGIRPQLPWAKKIVYTNNELEKNCEILFRLRDDNSLYVRKSVANHIRDIQKANPEIANELTSSLNGKSDGEKWILRYLKMKPVRSTIRKNR